MDTINITNPISISPSSRAFNFAKDITGLRETTLSIPMVYRELAMVYKVMIPCVYMSKGGIFTPSGDHAVRCNFEVTNSEAIRDLGITVLSCGREKIILPNLAYNIPKKILLSCKGYNYSITKHNLTRVEEYLCLT